MKHALLSLLGAFLMACGPMGGATQTDGCEVSDGGRLFLTTLADGGVTRSTFSRYGDPATVPVVCVRGSAWPACPGQLSTVLVRCPDSLSCTTMSHADGVSTARVCAPGGVAP